MKQYLLKQKTEKEKENYTMKEDVHNIYPQQNNHNFSSSKKTGLYIYIAWLEGVLT